MTSIGVVIITAGRDRHLRRALDGLARQRRPADAVVVVDMDGSSSARQWAAPGVEVITAEASHRLPLAASRNAGAAAVGTSELVFLDVDCIPHGDLVADYAAALGGWPDALACGTVRYLREAWDADGQATDELDVRSDPHPARPAPAAATLDHEHHELFWSLNFAVTSACWHRIGGFDEDYQGYGGEDTDLAFRARADGVPLLWLPGAVAYHQWHPPSRHEPGRTGDIVANARRFHQRWGTWPMEGWLRELAAAGAVRFDPSAGVLEEVAWTR